MFGITCAPEIFQKAMEQILSGCSGCLNFIDDIIIFGMNKAEHDNNLKKVLSRLKERNVALNESKCIYAVEKLTFLGHKLSSDGVTPSQDKIHAIKKAIAPKNADEVRSFLGLINYVGKFIPNLATLTDPLRKLTKKNVHFFWKKEQQVAFVKLKEILSGDSILSFYKLDRRTRIIADASPVGLGAILMQFDEQNEPRIISYASKSLNETEQRYCQTEKEALALVWAVERFHFFIFGREFELVTDHKPLEIIFGPNKII